MIRNVMATIGVLSIIVGASAAYFFFGGYFNVAATAHEPGVIRWALIHVREASIKRHATDTASIELATDQIIGSGARAYSDRGCVSCHGAPGVVWNKFSEGLRPDPADLIEIGKIRSQAELYFVIKNGINMTGMPSFGSSSEQEIWSIVAFIKQLPSVSAEQFKNWSGNGTKAAQP